MPLPDSIDSITNDNKKQKIEESEQTEDTSTKNANVEYITINGSIGQIVVHNFYNKESIENIIKHKILCCHYDNKSCDYGKKFETEAKNMYYLFKIKNDEEKEKKEMIKLCLSELQQDNNVELMYGDTDSLMYRLKQ